VQAGFAVQVAGENQFADQLQFRLRRVVGHMSLFVVGDDRLEQILKSLITTSVVFAGDLQE
jgi:hypothetical protein